MSDVNFDGDIHSFTTPWVRDDDIPDPPVEGAIAWLNGREVDEVVLHTPRGKTFQGRIAVHAWLETNGYTGLRLVVTGEPVKEEEDDEGLRRRAAAHPEGLSGECAGAPVGALPSQADAEGPLPRGAGGDVRVLRHPCRDRPAGVRRERGQVTRHTAGALTFGLPLIAFGYGTLGWILYRHVWKERGKR